MDQNFYQKLEGKSEQELLAYYCSIVALIDARENDTNQLLKNVDNASAEYFEAQAMHMQNLKDKKRAVERKISEIHSFTNRETMKEWISKQYEQLKNDSEWKQEVMKIMRHGVD